MTVDVAPGRTRPAPSGDGRTVLLIYDGFELRAAERPLAKVRAWVRGQARAAVRRLEGVQPTTGLYVAFRSLESSLTQAGYRVRVNDFDYARAHPETPIGMFGYRGVLDWLELPNPKLLGPGGFGSPAELGEIAAHPTVKAVIQPCDWYVELHRPYCGDKMACWPAGIDVDRYADASGEDKTLDVLIYDKIRWNRGQRTDDLLFPLLHRLQQRGLSYRILLYGYHNHKKYMRLLRHAKAMAFICEHESQGLACQEAMSMNIPVFAWDEGVLTDPREQPFAPEGLKVTSVPYFDERCGVRFTIADAAERFDDFWDRLGSFRPRDYVIEHLSPPASARQYLEIYERVAAGG